MENDKLKDYVASMIMYLNEIAKLDPQLMYRLVNDRVPCNKLIRKHPTVQAFNSSVGLLGIINGFFGVDEASRGPIMATLDHSAETVEFGINKPHWLGSVIVSTDKVCYKTTTTVEE